MNTASDKQINFITKLVEEKGLDWDHACMSTYNHATEASPLPDNQPADFAELSSFQASKLISYLLNQSSKAKIAYFAKKQEAGLAKYEKLLEFCKEKGLKVRKRTSTWKIREILAAAGIDFPSHIYAN